LSKKNAATVCLTVAAKILSLDSLCGWHSGHYALPDMPVCVVVIDSRDAGSSSPAFAVKIVFKKSLEKLSAPPGEGSGQLHTYTAF